MTSLSFGWQVLRCRRKSSTYKDQLLVDNFTFYLFPNTVLTVDLTAVTNTDVSDQIKSFFRIWENSIFTRQLYQSQLLRIDSGLYPLVNIYWCNYFNQRYQDEVYAPSH